MLPSINHLRSAVGCIGMRLDRYHRSSSPIAQYLSTRVNTECELICLETNLTNVNNYSAAVSITLFHERDIQVNALNRCACSDVGITN